jgi:hypothetical protein
MNVLGAHIMVCLRKLEGLEGGTEGICLFLKGFVDWKIDMRHMLEEVYMRTDVTVPTIEENAEKHVKVIMDKLKELVDGVSGILTQRNKDLFKLVAKGNALIRDIIGEKIDNGFLGIGQNLKDMMDDLINHIAEYFEKPKNLIEEIDELKDISEYNSYIRKRVDESVLLEEEILTLNQNQPSLDQMNNLFSQQEAKFEEIKIQLFNDSSTIHEGLKEIKELKRKKSNIDLKLNKFKNSIITEVKFVENKLSALQIETSSISGELKKSLNNVTT